MRRVITVKGPEPQSRATTRRSRREERLGAGVEEAVDRELAIVSEFRAERDVEVAAYKAGRRPCLDTRIPVLLCYCPLHGGRS